MKHVYSFITKKLCLLVLLSGSYLLSIGQTTISTETGTNYTGANGVSGNAAITFVVENTSASAKILTQVDVFFNPSISTSGTVCTLWYSTTSLGGAPTIATPVWTSIATSGPITFTTSGYYPVFTGLNFTLPASTQIRFAVQSSQGITYSGAAGPPSPNTFSAGGVNLETFDFQAGGGNVGYGGSFPSPANNPRAFTGRITFIPATPCAGTPTPGNTVSTANPVCPGANFTLSPQNATAGSGVTYQYQSSTDGVTWFDITGATSSTYTTSTTVPKYYRVKVTCSGSTATSNPIQITVNNPSNCYCTPPATNCTFSDVITNVTLGTINNTSACSPNGYANYTTTPGANFTTNLTTSTTVPMSVTVGPGGTEYVGVWIDYNQNGVFEPSEFTALGSANGAVVSSNINVPSTALAGPTRMRVRLEYSTPLTGTDACVGYTYGETEDYKVTIVINTCVAGTVTSQPSNVTITCNQNATFTANTNANGTALTYQWQESTNGGTSYTNLTNTGVYSGVTTNTLTLTAVPASFNNNRYRLQVSGQCTPANTFSNPATLTVTQPTAPTIAPTSPVVCQGGIVPISITSAGSPTTTTFSSGTIAVLVPDNNVAGATHTIPVSGIPAGSIITGVTVAINMTHTYIGDEVFALKAPNGSILNLDYYLTATAGGPAFTYPTTGFTNTRFSSAGTAFVSSGTFPYNAIYRPDGYVGAGPAVPGSPSNTGPTGYSATVATFPGLYSVPNGNWTLAMYDGGAGDVGTLTSWSVTISYGLPTAGVWSPNTGLYTDPAATVPYTGTAVNTVYAKPAATTNYTVTVTQGGCSSPSTAFTVTVNTPTTIATQPVSSAVCAGNNTSFSATAAGTGPFSYQWQVSTDNGATYNNIGGATSSTYAITGATNSMNGYKYRVVVTGAAPCSPATSSAATLTVNPLPVLSISASPRTKLIPTTTTTLTGNVTPSSTGTFTWFLNGNPVPSATRGTLVVDIDHIGDYTALYTDNNGCISALSNTVTISDTASGQIFLYPNPNNGKFHVRFYTPFYDPSVGAPPGVSNIEVRYISVYDMLGHRILDKPFSVYAPYGSMDVDLTPFGKGTYFIMVKDVQGKKLASGRAVIQ